MLLDLHSLLYGAAEQGQVLEFVGEGGAISTGAAALEAVQGLDAFGGALAGGSASTAFTEQELRRTTGHREPTKKRRLFPLRPQVITWRGAGTVHGQGQAAFGSSQGIATKGRGRATGEAVFVGIQGLSGQGNLYSSGEANFGLSTALQGTGKTRARGSASFDELQVTHYPIDVASDRWLSELQREDEEVLLFLLKRAA